MSDDQSTSAPARPRRRFTVDALFSDTRPQAVGVSDLIDAKLIELHRIVGDPAQPRRTFDPDRLDELVASIRAEGVLQPIVVRFDPDHDRYVVIHGERRLRAAVVAGIDAIPAIVRDVEPGRRLVQQLMENVVRDDLNAVDRAAALRRLKSQLDDAPWEEVAAAVGIKRSRIFQLLGTEKLSAQAQEDIQAGRLSEKQSRALQGLPPVRAAALRALMLAERLPAPTLTRIARTFRDMPLPAEDAETATRALRNLRNLVVADDPNGMRQQTSTLLRAIRSAANGASSDRRQLKQFARLVAAPSYTPKRVTSDIASMARALATLPRESLDSDSAIASSLAELRDTLDTLLADRRQDPS